MEQQRLAQKPEKNDAEDDFNLEEIKRTVIDGAQKFGTTVKSLYNQVAEKVKSEYAAASSAHNSNSNFSNENTTNYITSPRNSNPTTSSTKKPDSQNPFTNDSYILDDLDDAPLEYKGSGTNILKK